MWRVGAAGLAAAVLVVAGANTSIQHKPPAVLAGLALRCVCVACWCRWRFVPCWPFAGRFARFRCAGGINAPAAPVALNIRPFPCLVSVTYISTSRASYWRRPCVGVALPCVRPCVAFAWLAGRARRFNKRRRDFIPRGWRCPRQSINAPVLPIFRRFGGRLALR